MRYRNERTDPVADDSVRLQSGAAYLVGTWLLSAAVHVYIIVPASVLPRIATNLGITQTTAVWLISAVLVAWAGTNFGVGVVIDSVGDYVVVVVGGVAVVVSAIAGWVAAADGLFWLLIGTRVVAGVAIGAIWIASTTLVGRLFTIERRATALGLFTTSAPAGFAVGQVLGPRVTNAADWPAIFVVGGVLSATALVVFGLVHLVDRGASNTQSDDGGATDGQSVRQRFGVTLRNRTVIVGAAAAFVAYSLYLFLNSWLPTYLVETIGLSIEAGAVLAAVFPAMGIISRAGGGVVSDRLFGHRRLPVLKWSFVVATPVVLLLGVSTSIPILVALLVVGGLVIQLTFGVVYSYVQEAVDPENAGTALSILGSAGISGAFSAPVIAGGLIDLTGTYTAAFAYAVGLGVVGIGLVFVTAE